ncbi:acyltransferase [Tabrizicola aquatica]|uniref:acyltransferase n=1 Tax=Tabrizicola aquatica TaxID=909926 RepID=UPI000CD2E230|nr:acyltransferase [Tabrizicola aquatica]
MAYLSQEALEAMGFAYLGKNVRISDKASIYNADQMRIGDNSRIDDFCVVSGKVEIGRNVHIAPLCLVAGGTPGIVFDDFSALAYHGSVFAQSDDYSGAFLTNPTVPARFTHVTRAAIRIGRHVLIATNCTICPGVELGDGSAVGACSLVMKSCPPWTILAGSPAKKLKDRRQDMLKLEAEYLASETASAEK